MRSHALVLVPLLLAAACSSSPSPAPSEKLGTVSSPDLVMCGPTNPDGSCNAPMQPSGGECCCPSSPPAPPDCNGQWWCGGTCAQNCQCLSGCSDPQPSTPSYCTGDPRMSWVCACLGSSWECSCNFSPVCGDGVCDSSYGESCTTCPSDCGPCTVQTDACGGCPMGQYCDTSFNPPVCIPTSSGGGGGGGGGGECEDDGNSCGSDGDCCNSDCNGGICGGSYE